MRYLIAGVAAVALAAGAASANPGNGNGKGPDKGKPQHAQSMNHGNGNAAKAKSNGPNGNAGAKKPSGPSMAMAAKNNGNGNGGGNAKKAGPPSNAKNNGNGNAKANKPDKGPPMQANRNGASFDRGNGNGNDGRVERALVGRVLDDGRRMIDRRGWHPEVQDYYGQRGLINGCPPGLAKKNNGCQPPGQAKKNDNRRWYDRPDWWGYSRLGGGNYYYDDGYLFRLGSGGGIASYLPLLGGALSIGNRWPSYYEPMSLSPYYESYYGLGPSSSYRYANDVIYRVDPETAAITSIAALLTGDDFQIGSPMPMGYDVYNVPAPYRQTYYDRPDANYRYSDGYVYQVDPQTKLIAAAIELIAS